MARILASLSAWCLSLVARVSSSTPPNPPDGNQTPRKDSRVWKNFGQLVSGRLVSAVFTLVATAVMARALGPGEFGLVVLLHTYVLTVRALFNLKPAETFVNFGVGLIDSGNKPQVNRLLGLIRSFEWVTMLLATALGVMAAPLVAPLLGLPEDAIGALMVYSLVLLTSPVGTARGFFRATERFDVLRTSMAIGPAARLVGVLLAWYYSASWHYFALAWGVSLAVAYLFLGWRGRRLMRSDGFTPEHLSWRKASTEFPGFPGFVGVVYGQGLLDQLPKQLITLLIGGFLGAASAGLYRVAREIADVLAKPVMLIRQAAFTEITRIRESGPEGKSGLSNVFVRYGLRMLAPAALLVIVASYFREELLVAIAGPEYVVAGTLLVLLLIAAAIELVGAVLRPTAYAYGKAGVALRVQLAAMLTYVCVFVVLSQNFGLLSVGIAAVAAALLTLVVLGALVRGWARKSGTG